MLEMVDPWIEILGYKKQNINNVQTTSLFWKVNGCTTQIDMAQYHLRLTMGSQVSTKDYKYVQNKNSKWFCYLNGSENKTVFESSFEDNDSGSEENQIIIQTLVDFKLSQLPENKDKVRPSFVLEPQL